MGRPVKRQAGNPVHRATPELRPSSCSWSGFWPPTGANNFEATLTTGRRSQLYGSLAGTADAHLGFLLAALSILVRAAVD